MLRSMNACDWLRTRCIVTIKCFACTVWIVLHRGVFAIQYWLDDPDDGDSTRFTRDMVGASYVHSHLQLQRVTFWDLKGRVPVVVLSESVNIPVQHSGDGVSMPNALHEDGKLVDCGLDSYDPTIYAI
jgi:hypothetical protein